MQRPILASDLVQLGDVVLNISGRVPISFLELVLLGIQVLFAIRDRYIFTKLKTAVNTVGRREGCCQKCADQKSWTPAGLKKKRQNSRGIGKKITTEVILHLGRAELGQVLGKLRLRIAPGEISVGLRESGLSQCLHHFRPGESLG